MIKRCPQCGTVSDDQYGFCIKCGHEFPKIESKGDVCPLCGFENPEEAEYCVKCGTPLIFKPQFKENPNGNINQIIIKKEISGNTDELKEHTPNKWLIIFGYVFSIFGGILGLIIAIYLSTRKDPISRRHGHVQLAIFVFYIALIGVLYLTGNIPADLLNQYEQILKGNLTSLNR